MYFIVILFFEKWFHIAQANLKLFVQPRMMLSLRFSCHYLCSVGIISECWAALIFCDFPVQQGNNYQALLTNSSLLAKLNFTKLVN